MRIILVPVADRPECGKALDSAFALAARLDANVRACHIRPHRYSTVKLPAEAGAMLSDDELPRLSAADEKSAVAASRAARALVERLAAARDFSLVRRLNGESTRSIVWSEDVGSVQKLMPVIGPFADLIAVTRPRKKSSRIARLFLEESLLSSSRPVLVLPPGRRVVVGKRIVIGWDRTHNAMAAVVAALPLLRRAEAVSIVSSGAGKANGPKARRLVNYLQAWGVKATVRKTRDNTSDPVTDIAKQCEEFEADLLVIGSYSRSRFRQRIFGGVTEHFINRSRLPLLTIHR